MKKFLMLLLSIVISASVFIGCTTTTPVKEDVHESISNKIISFVDFLDYSVIDEVELAQTYKFEKHLLGEDLFKTIWDLQRASSDDYINKIINIYKINVNSNKINSKNSHKTVKTELYIMVSDEDIFGGYSIAEIEGERKFFTLDSLDLDEFSALKKFYPIIEVSTIDKDVIITDLFTSYLNANREDWYFAEVMKLDREPVETWTDFNVNDIRISNDNEDFFTADISYNIKTTAESNYFAVGNGVVGDDYWINKKSNFFNILKVGENRYAILRGYTG